jgi:Holliday junction resolvase RusA-like endonuclease
MDERKMSTLTFQVTGEPKGQPRPRAFARKMGAVHVARFYDSDVADEWKRAVQIVVLDASIVHKWPLTLGPVAISMCFSLPRPKSHFGAKGLKASAPVHHSGKPDADNLAKLVMDQITKSGKVWRDDSQVVSLTAHKVWASGNESGCSVLIAEAGI